MDEMTGATGQKRDPEQIRAEIEQTRAELGETLSALKDRLSPETLKQQFMDNVQNATVGRAKKMLNVTTERAKEWSSTASDTLRTNIVIRTILNNPIPAALAGVAIGWLILKGPGTNGYDGGEEETGWEIEGESSTREKAGQMIEQARERAGEAVGQAMEKAGQMAEQARDKAGQMAEQAKEKANRIRATTGERAQAWKERYFDVLENRPMVLVAAALALGIVVGFSIPETGREHQLMGETKDRLLSRAKGMAQDTLQKAECVVQ